MFILEHLLNLRRLDPVAHQLKVGVVLLPQLRHQPIILLLHVLKGLPGHFHLTEQRLLVLLAAGDALLQLGDGVLEGGHPPGDLLVGHLPPVTAPLRLLVPLQLAPELLHLTAQLLLHHHQLGAFPGEAKGYNK